MTLARKKQDPQRHLAKKGMSVKTQNAAKGKKKTQTFVLRVWERAEGTRYELRTLSGERTTFKTLAELTEYVNASEVIEEVE
jgi:phosphohistidine phosphatase SixA